MPYDSLRQEKNYEIKDHVDGGSNNKHRLGVEAFGGDRLVPDPSGRNAGQVQAHDDSNVKYDIEPENDVADPVERIAGPVRYEDATPFLQDGSFDNHNSDRV